MATPPNPVPTAAVNVPPPGVPARTGSSSLAVLLGLFGAGIAVLVIITVSVLVFLFRGSEIRHQGRELTISTPMGELKVDRGADPGLPKYPGASVLEEGADVRLTAPTDDNFEIIAARFKTSDSLQQVDDWYGERLKSDFERKGPGRKVLYNSRGKRYLTIESGETAYVQDHNDRVALVILKPRISGVEIKLLRIGPREVQ